MGFSVGPIWRASRSLFASWRALTRITVPAHTPWWQLVRGVCTLAAVQPPAGSARGHALLVLVLSEGTLQAQSPWRVSGFGCPHRTSVTFGCRRHVLDRAIVTRFAAAGGHRGAAGASGSVGVRRTCLAVISAALSISVLTTQAVCTLRGLNLRKLPFSTKLAAFSWAEA